MSKIPKITDHFVTRIQTRSYFVYAIPENVFQVTDVQNLTFLRETFSSEINRLQTFQSYPLRGIYASFLAADGFIYQGNGYEALCVYCGRRNSIWNIGDDVHELHRQLSPGCPVVTGVNLNNIRFHNSSSIIGEFEGIQYRHQVQADNDQDAEFSTTNGDIVRDSLPAYVEQAIIHERDLTFNSEDAHPSFGISPQVERSVELDTILVQNPDSISQLDIVSEDSTIALTTIPTSRDNILTSSDTMVASKRTCDRAQDVILTNLHEQKIKIHISNNSSSNVQSLESGDNEPTLQDALITHSSDITEAHESEEEYVLTLNEGQRISEITLSLCDNSEDTASPTIKTSTEVNNGNVHLRFSCPAHRTSGKKMTKNKKKTELQKNGEALIRNLQKDKAKLKTLPDEDKQEVHIMNDPAVKLVVAMGYKEENVWRIATTLAENSLPMSSATILEMLKQELKHTLSKEQLKLSEAIRRMKESYSILPQLLQEFHTSH